MITAHSRVKHKRRQRHRVHHSKPRRRFFSSKILYDNI